MSRFKKIATLLIVILFVSTKMSYPQQFQLKDGDLLFQDMDCGPMCEAIEAVTTGINGAQLSHVGMVVIHQDSTYVLEAISRGVILTPLAQFLNRSHDKYGHPKVLVGRLKQSKQELIPKVLSLMEDYLGKPYNHTFIWGNDNYYCSQLLYLLFRRANNNEEIFSLSPMTFKEPGKNHFFEVWINYYKKLEIDIPEGKPGCNPGGLSQSSYLELVHEYGFPDGYQK